MDCGVRKASISWTERRVPRPGTRRRASQWSASSSVIVWRGASAGAVMLFQWPGGGEILSEKGSLDISNICAFVTCGIGAGYADHMGAACGLPDSVAFTPTAERWKQKTHTAATTRSPAGAMLAGYWAHQNLGVVRPPIPFVGSLDLDELEPASWNCYSQGTPGDRRRPEFDGHAFSPSGRLPWSRGRFAAVPALEVS